MAVFFGIGGGQPKVNTGRDWVDIYEWLAGQWPPAPTEVERVQAYSFLQSNGFYIPPNETPPPVDPPPVDPPPGDDTYYPPGDEPGGIPMLITLGLLLTVVRFRWIAAGIMFILTRIAGPGGRIAASRWQTLPGPIRGVLTALGVTEGLDILVSGVDLPSPSDVPELFGSGSDDLEDAVIREYAGGGGVDVFNGGGGMVPFGVTILHHWTANGVRFVRLSNGMLGAESRRKGWKFWRPKKPIVLFAGGAGNLRTFLRADRALNNQAKQLQKALNRRAPRRSRSRTINIDESGPGSVKISR